MYCTSCGSKNDSNSKFCTSCGKALNIIKPVKKKSNSKKIVLISMLFVIVLMLGLIVLLLNSNNKRTIMLYIDGSNLESESGIISADLAAIDGKKIDLDNVNVLVYTGGTKEWQNNYISNDENAIFKLTKDGFKKIKTYNKLNMGDPNTLADFLTYSYRNYKAKHYNLVLYDHGGAIDGAIYDDFTDDNLTLEDFKIALKKSPFNKRNKLDNVIFRTCLNGTLEVASLFVDYSDYIIFSEEISYGGPYTDVLSFINNIEKNDNGYVVGKKFVDQYQIQMEKLDTFGSMGVTYSVVDLKKVNNVIKELDTFINGIDLKKNYSNVSRVRSNLYQYATSANNKTYDTVDLYYLVKGLEPYSSVKGDKLLKAIDDSLLYNFTNMNNSYGMSIYFPYNAHSKYKQKYLSVYKGLDFSNNYRDFIVSFYNAQSGAKSFGFNLTENETSTVEEGREVSLKLSDKEFKNYVGSRYIVFERNKEHPNYYMPIYSSNDVDVSEDGVIKTKIGNKLVTVLDEDDGERHYIPFVYRDIDGIETWSTNAVLYDTTKDVFSKDFKYFVTAYYKFKDGNPYLANAKVSLNDDERVIGSLLDINKFNKIEIYTPIYKILDENGNYTEEWEGAPEMYGFSLEINDMGLETSTLKDGEYYVVFYIDDINNNSYSSKLIKVGD